MLARLSTAHMMPSEKVKLMVVVPCKMCSGGAPGVSIVYFSLFDDFDSHF